MAKLVLIKAAAGCVNGSFRRPGRTFTTEGSIVNAADFSDEAWQVLVNERMLHLGPAPEEAAPPAPDQGALRDAIRAAIAQLEPADFGSDGAPKLAAVKKAAGSSAITSALLAEVWAEVKPAA